MTQMQREKHKKWWEKEEVMVDDVRYQWTYNYETLTPCGFNIEFASGRVMTSSMIYALIPQAYKNPLAFTLFRGIVTGTNSRQSNEGNHSHLLRSSHSAYPCGLYQISIPSHFSGKVKYDLRCIWREQVVVFQEMFEYLLERKMVPIGLYRSSDVHISRHPYVLTNPPPNLSLSKTDQIFVLAERQPNLWTYLHRSSISFVLRVSCWCMSQYSCLPMRRFSKKISLSLSCKKSLIRWCKNHNYFRIVRSSRPSAMQLILSLQSLQTQLLTCASVI